MACEQQHCKIRSAIRQHDIQRKRENGVPIRGYEIKSAARAGSHVCVCANSGRCDKLSTNRICSGQSCFLNHSLARQRILGYW